MALSVENISLKYDDLPVLDDVSFKINENEFVCLVGPSGCGKTSLLKIMAGLLKPDDGKVVLCDRPPSKGEIGYVFQEDSLFPWLSVKKNISFGLELKGVPSEEIHRRVEKYIELVGMQAFRDYFPKQLSGGMRQRVDIARSLAYGPKIILMDEPFNSLDAQARNEMQKEFLRIWTSEKKTVLMVTHSIDEAVFLANRVIVLSNRPSRLLEIVEIGLEHPRIRTSPEFNLIRQELLQMIASNNSKYI